MPLAGPAAAGRGAGDADALTALDGDGNTTGEGGTDAPAAGEAAGGGEAGGTEAAGAIAGLALAVAGGRAGTTVGADA